MARNVAKINNLIYPGGVYNGTITIPLHYTMKQAIVYITDLLNLVDRISEYELIVAVDDDEIVLLPNETKVYMVQHMLQNNSSVTLKRNYDRWVRSYGGMAYGNRVHVPYGLDEYQ